jgi:sugar lactone lactonase YvrE
LKKIYERIDDDSQERLLKGPETIFFDPEGNMYTINEDANLIQLSDFQTTDESDHLLTANVTMISDLGSGRPLGATFTPDGSTLYICDMVLGLTRLRNPRDPKSKVELVASSVLDNGTSSRIFLADDVVVGPKTGVVYFTDASVIYPERDRNLKWDAMYSSKVELLIGPSGRLLKYDPVTDEVSVLLRDLWFGNSVTVDQEETYLLFTESFSLRIGKYYLQGPKEGTVEYLVNGHPTPGCKFIESTVNTRHLHARLTFKTFSYDHDLDFDGVDCSWKGVKSNSSYCYSIIISYIVPAQKLLWKLPHPLDAIAKTILLMLPKSLIPKTKPYGGILAVDPEKTGSDSVVKLFQDPRGKDIAHLTGVTVHNNKLYLGSLVNNFVGVYGLD